jgi:hypothetical protein
VCEEISSVRRLLVTARVVPSSPILVTPSVLTRATLRNIPEDAILHRHRSENLKSHVLSIIYCVLHFWKTKEPDN